MSRLLSIYDVCKINSESITQKDEFDFINYLDTSNLTKNKIDIIQRFDKDFPSRAKRKVKKNTILYSTVRPSQEHFGIIEENDVENLIVSTGFLTIDVCDEGICPKYLYYKLTQPAITNFINSIAENSVSAYPSIKPEVVGNLIFNYPDLPTQQKIAAVLSALDDKIELNNKINAELEAMAKALYDYWFVQFEFPNAEGKPYKSSGGKMVYNPILKREIPEGWEVKRFGDVFNVSRGTIITKETSKEGQYKVVAAGLNYSYLHNEFNREKYTITVSGSGANAGYINFWTERIFASDCTTVRGCNDYMTFIGLQFLKLYQDYIFSLAKGSAQPHVYPSDIEGLNFTCIPDKLITEYGVYAMNIFEKISNNQKQNQELAALRDWLLPMLMNGQVKVE